MRNKKDLRYYIQKRLYFYHFLNDGITFVLPTIMTSFYIAFNLNWFQIGLVFAFNSLAMIIFQLIIGYYTDKDRPEFLLKFGIFLLTLTSFLMIFSYNFVSLMIFAIFSGVALAFHHSISYATTSRMYSENRDVMIGRQGAAGDIGKCIAVFSSALLLIYFNSWKLVLWIWTLISLISFLIIAYNLRRIKFSSLFVDINDSDTELVKINSNQSQKRLAFLIFSSFILYLATYTLLITNLATYLSVERSGIVSEYSGLILGYTLVFGVLGAYLSGIVKLKLGMTNSIIIFSILTIILLIFYVIMDSSDLIFNLFFYGTVGFFLFLMYPQLLAAVNNCFQTNKIGRGYGIILSLGWLGNFLGALIGGYYANLYSPNMFFVLSAISFIIIIIFAFITKLFYKI